MESAYILYELLEMEKLLNHYDREYMKMAMLKHEETFRQQVCELHRLYRIQKMLMKDIARNRHCADNPNRQCPAEPAVQEFIRVKCSVSEPEDDLELTLGPRSYYQKKSKPSETPALQSDSGTSLSSSSTGSSRINKEKRSTSEELSQQKWIPAQDRLNSPPWLFQALRLNMT